MMVWYGGIAGASAENQSWAHAWRVIIWPAYISYVEVGNYFNQHGPK